MAAKNAEKKRQAGMKDYAEICDLVQNQQASIPKKEQELESLLNNQAYHNSIRVDAEPDWWTWEAETLRLDIEMAKQVVEVAKYTLSVLEVRKEETLERLNMVQGVNNSANHTG